MSPSMKRPHLTSYSMLNNWKLFLLNQEQDKTVNFWQFYLTKYWKSKPEQCDKKKPKKETKMFKLKNKEFKLSLFTDNMIFYRENPNISPKNDLVQFSSVAQSCLTLCDHINRSKPGLPVHHQLPGSTQTHVHWVSDDIQPSHPLSFPSPPAPNSSQHQGLSQWVSSSKQGAKVLEFQLQHQSF